MEKMNFENKLMNDDLNKEYQKVIGKSKKPKILICTPEITELPEGMGNAAQLVSAKGGGLGDISASLIKNLNENSDYELHIALPKYDSKIKSFAKITDQQIGRLAVVLSGQGIHLVNDSAFSYLNSPYETNKTNSGIRKSLAYQRHVINLLLDYVQPDIVHCNDWMTGLIPAAAKAKGIKSLFTLHNIFTEKETPEQVELTGLKPLEFAEFLYFEKFPDDVKANWAKHFIDNRIDFTASGIYAADYFNTVSNTFLEELYRDFFPDIVSRPIFEVIKQKYENNRAIGILNAPNDTINSKLMSGILTFNKENIGAMKPKNKALFQEKMNLPIIADKPLFFWPNRLYFQKGPDLLADNIEYFFSKYDMQIAIVANGDVLIEDKLKKMQKKYPQLSFVDFDEDLSNLGKAGSDFILMPSRYEPCGLPQMEVLRFGTFPVVRATGGLKDTITQLDIDKNIGNGFVFHIADKAGLDYGFQQAIKFYYLPFEVRLKHMKRIIIEGNEKFSLKRTAEKYMQIYDKLLSEK